MPLPSSLRIQTYPFLHRFLLLALTTILSNLMVPGQRARRRSRGGVPMGLRNGGLGLILGSMILVLQKSIAELGFWRLQGSDEITQVGRTYFESRIWGAVVRGLGVEKTEHRDVSP